ncbi:ribosome small subunit-dependent GTPase A [Marinilabiliaceae bacterium JC017]|nr:ribosome small subunit-dependent GTPase A [Marinilabiliaceae bacterium JC017]
MKEGLVIKSTGSWYVVQIEQGKHVNCRIKGKFRLEKIKTTNPVAVGDKVLIELEENQEEGVIKSIGERKNYIIRKASNLSKESQILAANVDMAVLLVTINYPVTTTVFIDRFLAAAEAYGIPVSIVFNKVDRYDVEHQNELADLRGIYEEIGYDTYAISAKNQEDLSEIKELLKDRISVIAGHSGVGKSTLINRIEPGLKLKTAEISDAHLTGKHTTTFAEMHALSFGGYIIDTPGIRGFGLINIEKEELYHFFREIFKEAENCQFHNCTHIHEPGCAVKQAVEEGRIAMSRYSSYHSVFSNSNEKYR